MKRVQFTFTIPRPNLRLKQLRFVRRLLPTRNNGLFMLLVIGSLLWIQHTSAFSLLAESDQTNTYPVSGLVAYYSFNGQTNDTINANHATIEGNGVQYITGVHGNAIKFGGYNVDRYARLKVPAASSLQFSSAASFSLWLRLDSSIGQTSANCTGGTQDGAYQTLIGKSNDRYGLLMTVDYQNNQTRITSGLSSDGRLGFESGSATAIQQALGNWIHVAQVFDATGAKLYLNGALVYHDARTPDFSLANSRVLYFGLSPGEGTCASWWYPFNGALDEVRIYNRGLTAAEVQDLYQYPVEPTSTSTFTPIPTATQTPIPTSTPTVPAATPTSTFTLIPTATQTSIPTGTPTKTVTATPTPTNGSTTPAHISIGTHSAAPGSTVIIPVLIEMSSEKVGALSADVYYDSAMLTAIDCQADPGNIFNGEVCNKAYADSENSDGSIRFELISAQGVAGSATLANLSFQVKGESGNDTALTVYVAKLSNPGGIPLNVRETQGIIQIRSTSGNHTPTPTATPTLTANPDSTVTPIPTINPGGMPTIRIVGDTTGAPGSYFVVQGTNFPPNSTVSLFVDGIFASNLPVDANGTFTAVLITTTQTPTGTYQVSIGEQAGISATFVVDRNAPLEQPTPVALQVPIHNTKAIYLPLIAK